MLAAIFVSILLFFGTPTAQLDDVAAGAALAAAESTSEVDLSPASIVNDLIRVAPIAGVMLWLYLDERKERRALQAQYIELIKSTVPALEKSTITLDRVVGTVDHWVTQERVTQEMGGRANMPSRYEDRGGERGAPQSP